jgi:hypothetical protein
MSELIAFLEPDHAILDSPSRDHCRSGGAAAGRLPDHQERELVPFDTDAFVSYRRMPLAVVLPETTAQVAAVSDTATTTLFRWFRAAPARRFPVARSRRRMRS